jgi:hypothetical protein
MEFFKVINLEQSEEQVLLVKSQEEEKFDLLMFINVKNQTHQAKVSFDKEEVRDSAFDTYDEEKATNFLEFMHNSIIK